MPATAVIYATFGDSLFVIEKGEQPDSLKARQQFVRLGKTRGDFVEILEGLKAGMMLPVLALLNCLMANR